MEFKSCPKWSRSSVTLIHSGPCPNINLNSHQLKKKTRRENKEKKGWKELQCNCQDSWQWLRQWGEESEENARLLDKQLGSNSWPQQSLLYRRSPQSDSGRRPAEAELRPTTPVARSGGDCRRNPSVLLGKHAIVSTRLRKDQRSEWEWEWEWEWEVTRDLGQFHEWDSASTSHCSSSLRGRIAYSTK